jgi:hypothetical protein
MELICLNAFINFSQNEIADLDDLRILINGALTTCLTCFPLTAQVCKTQYTFQGTACTVNKRILTKGCVPASDCLTAASSPLCADYATTPVCTSCCNSTFCNYNIDETLTKSEFNDNK